MRTVFVNVIHRTNSFANGWTGSVAIAHGEKKGQNQIAQGESEIYLTKQDAWESIKKSVAKLDYDNDKIIFNNDIVINFAQIEQLIEHL